MSGSTPPAARSPADGSLDLARLSAMLRERFGGCFQASYLRGKTMIRDAVREHLRCSDVRAERIVDTLEARGFLRHAAGSPRNRARAVFFIDQHGV